MRGPAAVAATPPARPDRPGTLVVSSLTPDDQASIRWEYGIVGKYDGCGDLLSVFSSCATDVDDAASDAETVEFEPYVVPGADTCSTFGNSDGGDLAARATRRLLACETKKIEAEFWAGTLAQADGLDANFYLAAGTDYVLDELSKGTGSTTPVGLRTSIELLDQYLAETLCSRGMIHATPNVVAGWLGLGAIRREGNLYLSPADNVVVSGAGYPGTGPTGGDAASEDESWVWTSSMVSLYRSPVSVDEVPSISTINPETNTITVRARRHAATLVPACGRAALLVATNTEFTTLAS